MLPFLSTVEFRDKDAPEHSLELAHIRDCREMRGVEVCSACAYFESCDILKAYLRKQAGLTASGNGGGETA